MGNEPTIPVGRYLADRFDWAAPGDQQEDAWLVRFCDKDCGEAIFTGPDAEREAWEYWNRYAPAFNIYVFRLAALRPSARDGECERKSLSEGEWFYPEGNHSSDECRFSPDEVIDYALEGDSTTQIVAIERAISLPTVYAAVRVWSDAEKDARQSDEDYDYTLHATADAARAALSADRSDPAGVGA